MSAFVVRTSEEVADAIFRKLSLGSARIGWSYRDNLDLRFVTHETDENRWDNLDGDQQDAWYCHGFLDRVQNGDILFYPNVPSYGQFCVAEVTGGYEFLAEVNGIGLSHDFRSARACDLLTNTPVQKADSIVPPTIRNKLGLRRRFYQLYIDETIIKTFLENLASAGKGVATSLSIFSEMMQPLHGDLARRFTDHFPRANLSRLLADLLTRYGERVDLREGAGEKGSDLILEIASDFVDRPLVVGIQVGSFSQIVSRATVKEKLEQLLAGWEANTLDYGALVLTGRWDTEATEFLAQHNRDNPSQKVKKIDGEDLSRIVMRTTWLDDL
jgi:hypothetical protein